MTFETIRAGLSDVHGAHAFLMHLWNVMKPALLEGAHLHIECRAEKRSDPQNRRMWALLTEVSQQVDWYGQKLAPEEWKDVFSAALKKQKAVPGIDGGFVILGQRTSKMSRAEMSEMQTLIEAFGAQRGVQFALYA